jgi:hypothetical protein
MDLRLLSFLAVVIGALALGGVAGTGPSHACTTSCITEYPLQTTCGGPFGVVAGRDKSIAYGHANTVGRLAADGTKTEFLVPTAIPKVGVGARRWRDDLVHGTRGNNIGRIDKDGQVTEHAIPTVVPPPCAAAATSLPQGIAIGRYCAVRFTRSGSRIGGEPREPGARCAACPRRGAVALQVVIE